MTPATTVHGATMSRRGILWRVLGDDPELWQSAEAWAVVADLCEAEGHGERAERLRRCRCTLSGWARAWCSKAQMRPPRWQDVDGHSVAAWIRWEGGEARPMVAWGNSAPVVGPVVAVGAWGNSAPPVEF